METVALACRKTDDASWFLWLAPREFWLAELEPDAVVDAFRVVDPGPVDPEVPDSKRLDNLAKLLFGRSSSNAL